MPLNTTSVAIRAKESLLKDFTPVFAIADKRSILTFPPAAPTAIAPTTSNSTLSYFTLTASFISGKGNATQTVVLPGFPLSSIL